MDCPDGGRCHHDCTESCFRVNHASPLSGVFPNDEWPMWAKALNRPAPPTIPVRLTDRQARLYRTSARFKAGVDTFLQDVLPMYLHGLAERAEEDDARMEAMVARAKAAAPFFDQFEQRDQG